MDIAGVPCPRCGLVASMSAGYGYCSVCLAELDGRRPTWIDPTCLGQLVHAILGPWLRRRARRRR